MGKIKMIKKTDIKINGTIPMVDDRSLLLGKDFKLNDDITIHNPTIEEVLRYGDERYLKIVNSFVCRPIDCKETLQEYGIDYKKVIEFELFYIVTRIFTKEDMGILLGDLDLSKFELYAYEENGEVVMYDGDSGILIDAPVYTSMVDCIRRIHNIPKNDEKMEENEKDKFSTNEADDVMANEEKEPRKSVYQITVDENDSFKSMAMSTFCMLFKGYVGGRTEVS